MHSLEVINHIVGCHYLPKEIFGCQFFTFSTIISLILNENRKKVTLGESIPTKKEKAPCLFIILLSV